METLILNQDNSLSRTLEMETRGENISECLTCGICNSRCSWYDGPGGPVPRRIVRMALMGLSDVLRESSMIWDCHICNRCTLECPMGIDMEKVVRKARSDAVGSGHVPEDIKNGVERRLTLGDVNGLTKEDFLDTIEWLSGEFSDEVDDPDAVIPHDQKNAHFLYLPNPRELGVDPLHLMAMAKLFHTFGESWTMSSRHTDVTNWGYFLGDNDVARKMALQVVEAAEELGINTLVLSECGHATYVMKVILEELIQRKPGFSVITMPELALQKVEEGSLRLDPESHPYPIAYHDPCNLGRKSGIYDTPRKLLLHSCKEVVELDPNRESALCCGGGGGLLQDSTSTKRRMVAGEAKARQIKATGVEHVATACLSC
ncbi:(Fe-S)-binding protein, partial [Thermodesulfobacteriota bacterium]